MFREGAAKRLTKYDLDFRVFDSDSFLEISMQL